MKLSAIAAALTLCLPLAAQAGATSSAQLTNFHYEVIDLDLNDGITAALSLTPAAAIVGAAYFDAASGIDLSDDVPFGTASVSGAFGSASATLAGTSLGLAAAYGGSAGVAGGTVAALYGFTLTANTKLVLYADASASSTVSGGYYASSVAGLGVTNLGDPFDPSSVYLLDYVASDTGITDARTLSLSFTTGSTEFNGFLGYGGIAQVSAVPEPSQFALLTLGLAGLGWRLKRAKARKAA